MKFLCLGGDLRTIKLVQMLKEENHEVYTYGIEENIEEPKELDEIETIIGPIPFTKDGETLNAPFSKKEIYIEDIFPNLKEKLLIAGPIAPKMKEELKKNKTQVIDIMEIEE